MLCSKIEDAFATVFRQVVLTRFEQAPHKARHEEGELTAERINDAVDGGQPADARRRGEADRRLRAGGGAYIGHFIHAPFYCYAYAFGELLVLALVQKYQQEGAAFVPRFVDLLERGGSDTPQGLLAPFGVDLSDATFWQKGFDELARLVRQAEELAG